MNSPLLARLGAGSGGLFAIILVVAAGDGNGTYSAPRAIAGLAALALFVPFLAYLHSTLRAAEGADGWLASAALAAGLVGITLKIVSVIPALAVHRAGIAEATSLHKFADGLDNGTTVIALFPLAISCAAIAVVTLRTGALPRWLGIAAAVTATALAINGAFLDASFVPALLLFIAWTLLTSVHLLRTTFREPAQIRAPRTASTA